MKHIEKPWGYEEVLSEGTEYKIKKLVVSPGHELSLQYHEKRNEEWYVLQGTGVLWLSEDVKKQLVPSVLRNGDKQFIDAFQEHKVQCAGVNPLVILEIQMGKCDDEDIVRLEDPYDRDDYGFVGKN